MITPEQLKEFEEYKKRTGFTGANTTRELSGFDLIDKMIAEKEYANLKEAGLPSGKATTGDVVKSFGNTAVNVGKNLVEGYNQAGRNIGLETKALMESKNKNVGDISKNVGQFALRMAGHFMPAIWTPFTAVVEEAIPEHLKETIGKGVNEIANSNNPVSEKIKGTVDYLKSNYDKLDPDTQKNLEAVFNIATSLIGEKPTVAAGKALATEAKATAQATKLGAEKLATITKEGAGAVSENLAKRSAGKDIDRVWDIVKPKLTPTQQENLAKSIRTLDPESMKIVEKGVGPFKKMTLAPGKLEKEMIDVAHPYLVKVKNKLTGLANMKQGIIDKADNLASKLNESEAIWNQNELKGALNKMELPHMLTGDLNNSFNKTMAVILENAPKTNKKLGGLLDLRKKFDQVVSKEYPKIYTDEKLRPIKQAVSKTRSSINDLILSKIPKNDPNFVNFKKSLKEQHLLYQAVGNVSKKIGKMNENAIKNWVRKNPTKAALLFGAAGGLVTGGDKAVNAAAGLASGQ